MSIERPSLAAAFKPPAPDRTAGLAGLLTPPAAPAPAPARPRQAAERAPEKIKPESNAAQKSAQRTSRPKTEFAGVANVGVYLEPALLAEVRAARRRNLAPGQPDNTYDDILVQALNAVTPKQLDAAFAIPEIELNRFALPPRVRRPRGTAGIQIQLRLDGAQRAALDALKVEVDAPSRSALVAMAYRLYLNART